MGAGESCLRSTYRGGYCKRRHRPSRTRKTIAGPRPLEGLALSTPKQPITCGSRKRFENHFTADRFCALLSGQRGNFAQDTVPHTVTQRNPCRINALIVGYSGEVTCAGTPNKRKKLSVNVFLQLTANISISYFDKFNLFFPVVHFVGHNRLAPVVKHSCNYRLVK